MSDVPLADRLSCTDATFPLVPPETALAIVKGLGLPAVDLCLFPGGGHVHVEQAIVDPVGTAETLKRRLDAAGLRVADLFAITGEPGEGSVNHPDPRVRGSLLDAFTSVVEVARRIGAPGITLLPGVPHEGVDPQVSLELAALELQRHAALAGEAGLRFSIEPHVESIAETPASALELMRLAPDVTLTLDHSHFIFQGYAQAEADVLIPHAGHMHLRQAAKGRMQTRLAEGSIDFRALRDALAASGYAGALTIEYLWEEWFDCANVDTVSETALLRDLLLNDAP